MNPYEEAELEARDLTCEWCGDPISSAQYHDNEGLCDRCVAEATAARMEE